MAGKVRGKKRGTSRAHFKIFRPRKGRGEGLIPQTWRGGKKKKALLLFDYSRCCTRGKERRGTKVRTNAKGKEEEGRSSAENYSLLGPMAWRRKKWGGMLIAKRKKKKKKKKGCVTIAPG